MKNIDNIFSFYFSKEFHENKFGMHCILLCKEMQGIFCIILHFDKFNTISVVTLLKYLDNPATYQCY